MLVKDWKKIITKAYSVYALVGIAIVTAAPDLIYKFFERDTNPAVWAYLLYFFVIFGLAGRLIDQPPKNNLRRKGLVLLIMIVVLGLSSRAIAHPCSCDEAQVQTQSQSFDDISFGLISKWEGKRNYAYQDIVGVWTICYGHTKTARRGLHKTDTECRELLVEEIKEYRQGLHVYFNQETKDSRLTDKRDAAYTSLAYNVGIRGAGKSTATRRLNRADIIGGCKAITWWNKAGGRVVRGLTKRRAEEYDYCMEDA